jgi:hypothetical protein
MKFGTVTTWIDVSDEVSVLDPGESAKPTSEFYVFGETDSGGLVGKNGPMDITVRGIWTDSTAGHWYSVWSEHTTACGGFCQIRWAPAGCTTAHLAFTTHSTMSRVASFTYPGGDAASADALVWEAMIHTPAVTIAAYATTA